MNRTRLAMLSLFTLGVLSLLFASCATMSGPGLAMAASTQRPLEEEGEVAHAVEESVVETPAPETEQSPEARAMAYWDVQRQNFALLRGHSWKTRTQLRSAGAVSAILVERIVPDEHGDLRVVVLRGQGGADGTASEGGLAPALSALVRGYALPQGAALVKLLQEGTQQPGTGRLRHAVGFSGTSFLVPGDEVTLWLDRATGKPERFEFRSELNGDRVEGVLHYRVLPNGPFYAAYAGIEMPGPGTSATVESFEFLPLPR